MTKDKALKQDIRARMEKTGEQYTTARHHLLGVHLEANSADPNQPDGSQPTALPARIAEPEASDAAVAAATGKTWDEWFVVLDAWGASTRTHAEIARYLNETFPIGGWWAQGVTVGYERARGMRAVHQRIDGFSANASKTVNHPLELVYAQFAQDDARERWLPAELVDYFSSTPNKAWRFNVPGTASRVEVRFTAKSDMKTMIAVEQTKLTDAAEAAHWKAFWKEHLALLEAELAERS